MDFWSWNEMNQVVCFSGYFDKKDYLTTFCFLWSPVTSQSFWSFLPSELATFDIYFSHKTWLCTQFYFEHENPSVDSSKQIFMFIMDHFRCFPWLIAWSGWQGYRTIHFIVSLFLMWNLSVVLFCFYIQLFLSYYKRLYQRFDPLVADLKST